MQIELDGSGRSSADHHQFELRGVANLWGRIGETDPCGDSFGGLQDLSVDCEEKAADGLNSVCAVPLVDNSEFLPGLDPRCIGMEVVPMGDAPSADGSDVVYPVRGLQSIRPVIELCAEVGDGLTG